MKRIIIATGLILSVSCRAQTGFYFGVVTGYQLPAVKQLVGNNTSWTRSGTDYQGVFSSFGTGLQPGIRLGWNAWNKIGIEVDYSCLLSTQYRFVNTYDDSNYHVSGSVTTQNKVIAQRISPGLRFDIAKCNKWTVYNSASLLLGISTRLFEESYSDRTDSAGTDHWQSSSLIKGHFSAGFNDVLGVCCQLNRLCLALETNFTFQSCALKSGELKSSTFNGVDQMPTLETWQKEFVYENTMYEQPIDTGKPRSVSSTFIPLSSYGLQFSVRYSFSKKNPGASND